MFPRRRYIFETRGTRLRRRLAGAGLAALSLLGAHAVACLVLVGMARREAAAAEAGLWGRGPDLIAVFTGDRGRIPLAVRMAARHPGARVFITGVFSENSVDTLLDPIPGPAGGVDKDLLAIDHLAGNTFENALATWRHIRENRGVRRVLVVSHDYHIMRIKVLMGALRRGDRDLEFFYTGVPADYRSPRNVRILSKEVLKFARTYLFLLSWEE